MMLKKGPPMNRFIERIRESQLFGGKASKGESRQKGAQEGVCWLPKLSISVQSQNIHVKR